MVIPAKLCKNEGLMKDLNKDRLTNANKLGVTCLPVTCGVEVIGMLLDVEEDDSQWPVGPVEPFLSDVPPEIFSGSSPGLMTDARDVKLREWADAQAAEVRVASLLAADIARASVDEALTARRAELEQEIMMNNFAARRAELEQELELGSVDVGDDAVPVQVERAVLTLHALGMRGDVPNLDSTKGVRVARKKLVNIW